MVAHTMLHAQRRTDLEPNAIIYGKVLIVQKKHYKWGWQETS